MNPRTWRQLRRSQSPPHPKRGGEVPRWSAYDVSPLGLPGAHERGDSCADRKPPRGRRGPEVARVRRTSAGPPRSPRTWR
eukprot:1258603-Pyramimonas_sp.AAC.1